MQLILRVCCSSAAAVPTRFLCRLLGVTHGGMRWQDVGMDMHMACAGHLTHSSLSE
jgi:hypothetical protein